MMHPKYNLQGPAAHIAPLNHTDPAADVGTMPSTFYRKEILDALMLAKCPLELTPARAAEYVAQDIHRMFPSKAPDILVVVEQAYEPPRKKPRTMQESQPGKPLLLCFKFVSQKVSNSRNFRT